MAGQAVRAAPEYIRAAATTNNQPTSLLASALLKHEYVLRSMCFLDNEHGANAASDVFAIAQRVVTDLNTKYAVSGRRIRILDVAPLSVRHHHIVVKWGEVERQQLSNQNCVIFNLYPLSKRKPEDEEEEDGKQKKGAARISAPSRGQGRHGNKMTMKELADACETIENVE